MGRVTFKKWMRRFKRYFVQIRSSKGIRLLLVMALDARKWNQKKLPLNLD